MMARHQCQGCIILYSLESGDNLPVFEADDSDNTTTSKPWLVGPTVPEPIFEHENRFQDDTVRK